MRKRLSRRRWWVVALAIVVVAGATGTWLMLRDTTPAVQTSTGTVTSGTFKTTVSASGTVAAAKQADLSFGVGGTVTSVKVAAGDKVTKGQVLATVGTAPLKASVTAAQSALTAASSQLGDDTDASASDTQLAADRAAVTSAESTLDSAEADLKAATLRATMSGTVAAVDLAVGDELAGSSGGSAQGTGTTQATSTGTSTGSGSSSTTATDAITLVTTKAFVVDATIASSDLDTVRKGMQAQLAVTGLDDTVYGTVSSIGLVAQTSSSGAAEFPLTIAVTGTPKNLYAGSSATASIIVKQETGVLTVPTQALHTSGSTTYVNKIVAGKPVRTTVVTGTAYGPSTEVTSGLKAGDTVEIAAFTRPSGTNGTTGRTGEGGFPQGGFPQGGFGQGGPPGGDPGGGQ